MSGESDCIFCKIAAGEVPADTVYEDETAVAFRDINPQAPVHIQVIPRRHVARLSDCAEAEKDLLGHLMLVAGRIAGREGLEFFRTVVNCGEGAGQSVWHLHVHVLGGRALRWPPG